MNAVIFIRLVFCLFFVNHFAFAQMPSDTLSSSTEEADTVRIKKRIVVKKTVYLPALPETDRLFLSIYGGVYGDKSYYKVCDVCKDYFDKLQGTRSFAWSYTYGVDLAYTPRKWYVSIGASISNYQYAFQFTDSAGVSYKAVNQLSYIGANWNVGYWLRKEKKGLSTLVLIGPSYNWLKSASGYTLARQNPSKVAQLQDEVSLYPTNITLNAALRFSLHVGNRVAMQGDIFYAYDLRTIVKGGQFTQQRNMLGIKLGLSYRLR